MLPGFPWTDFWGWRRRALRARPLLLPVIDKRRDGMQSALQTATAAFTGSPAEAPPPSAAPERAPAPEAVATVSIPWKGGRWARMEMRVKRAGKVLTPAFISRRSDARMTVTAIDPSIATPLPQPPREVEAREVESGLSPLHEVSFDTQLPEDGWHNLMTQRL